MCGSPPRWLEDRLQRCGGSVSFATFMQWALHDPEHGYYGAGRARIGTAGDFTTSPSMGSEFSGLLLPQLSEWLEQISCDALALLEAGPGEGQLASQLAKGLARQRPDLAARTELVLLEPNPGMASLQQGALAGCPLQARWASWDGLRLAPCSGVVIAHEVLDALAVERVLWDGLQWRWQHVALQGDRLGLVEGPKVDSEALAELSRWIPLGSERPPGWCTEVHTGLLPWFQACANALQDGVLLVVDYALEARRYYAHSRANGTLMAYRQQRASPDPLLSPGEWDLTAHLCLETVEEAAAQAGWRLLGQRRQGEALLALGLAQRLASLSQSSALALSEGLQRREQLLRLVDPLATGEFRWLVFQRLRTGAAPAPLRSCCLAEPPLP